MKFKFKLLAAAAALALSGAPAFAAINTSATPDLIVVAWVGDGTAPADTYVRDLGSISQIGANNVSFAAPSASIFSTQFAGISPSKIYWNVFALDNVNGAEYLTGSVGLQTSNINDPFGYSSTLTTLATYALPNLQLASNNYVKPNGEFTGTADNNISTSNLTNGFVMSFLFEQGLYTAGHGVGSSQNFMYVDPSADPPTQLFTNAALSAATDNTAGNTNGGYFSLLDAAGDLSWTGAASVAAVPLPAGALLFGPGLLALLGFGRRRKDA